jgi:NDP-sugar pyrophosphorylase family protein
MDEASVSPRGPLISAVLFCAGRGNRMRPLTDEVAKPALRVGGRPLGAYAFDLLRAVDGTVAVNLSWLHQSLRATLEPYAPAGTKWVVELPEPLGTGGTVASLLRCLAESFVAINGDTITDLALRDLIATHRRLGAAATLAVKRVSKRADFAIEGERAVRLVDRKRDEDAAGALYIGACVLRRAALEPLLAGKPLPFGLAEAVFEPLARRGDVGLHFHDGVALDVGTPQALARARVMALAGELP